MSPRGIFQPGEQIGDYTVTAYAGSGNSGTLYRVKDISGGVFILKLIPAEHEYELAALEQYRKLPYHPGITAVHGAGKVEDGCFYYLMDSADNLLEEPEYLPDTLDNRLARNGPMNAEEVLVLAEQLLSAVRHLHRNQMAHFDIKPENVIFCSGKAKLADFGSLSPCSGTGIPNGTPGFFPEEELVSSVNGGFSKKNDLYAVGMTLYCAWSGRSPDEFPDLPETPDKAGMITVRKLCLRACNPSPAYRFQSAEEFLHGVYLAKKKLRSEPKRWKMFAGLALFLTVSIGAFMYWTMPWIGEEQFRQLQDLERTAQMAEDSGLLKELLFILPEMTEEERKESKIDVSIATLQKLREYGSLFRKWQKNLSSSRMKKQILDLYRFCPKGFSRPQGFRALWKMDMRLRTLSPEEEAMKADPHFAALCFELWKAQTTCERIRVRKKMRLFHRLKTGKNHKKF